MSDAKEILQQIEDKREEMQPVFDRMDEDEKLHLLEPYKLKKLPPQQSKDMEGVANITLPGAQVFVNKGIALLGGLDMQRVVEGNDIKDKQTTKIEDFLADTFYVIDERLVKRGLLGLNNFIDEQGCVRGRIPARSCVTLDEKGNLVPDVLPLDARCFVSDNDGEKMIWAAPWFTRSKAQIEREYGEGYSKGGKESEVIDYWDSERNIVFIDGKVAQDQPNPYKYPPFVLSIVPFGSMLSTKTAQKHQGESILWSTRELWNGKNMIATILATLTIEALRGGMQLESSQGLDAKKPDESPYGAEKVNPVEKGMGYKAMPINDIKAATNLLYSMVEADIQRTTFTALDYGSLNFPLSGVVVAKLLVARNDIMLPRINAKAVFHQSLSRMIIDQCIQLGKSFKLGQPGNQNTYTKSDLKGDYQITYKFRSVSQEQMAADLSYARAAKGVVSDNYIRRRIMQVEDPDGMDVEIKSEEAERVDEVLFLFRRAYSLVDKDKPTEQEMMESKILVERAKTILKQRRAMGQLSDIEGQRTPETEQKGKELLPLFGQGKPQQAQKVENG